MKKTFILLPLVGLFLFITLSSYHLGPGLTLNTDYTGASGTQNCGSGPCHAIVASTSTTIKIELFDMGGALVTTGYVGGTSYKLRVTGTNTGSTLLPNFGFQLSVVKNGTTTNEGTLSAITGTHKGTYETPGIVIVEHSSSLAATTLVGGGGAGTMYVQDIPWTAPAALTGTVKAFAILNAVNNNGIQDMGDLWNNTSLIIPEATSTGAITGTMTVCVGATTTLSDATTPGTWSTPNTTIATVGSTTGIVTGVAPGTATISYTASSGTATTTVTVNTATPAAIMGASVVCVGMHIILSDATPGGYWTTPMTTIATAGSTSGVITGVTIGTATITYGISNSCGIGFKTFTVSVHSASGCVSGVNAVSNPVSTEIKLYPNPNTGIFTVNLLSEDNLQADVTITNMAGETIKEFTTYTNKAVDIKIERPAGIYFLTARTANGIYVSRMMVE